MEGFNPDSQHLLWRGQVSAFSHKVDRDQVWYYRVRAVNYHDRPSDWSNEVSAATERIITEDILFGEEMASRLRELNDVSRIIGEGGIDFDLISENAKSLINQEARQYTDQEIEETEFILMQELADKAGLDYVNNQLVDKVNVGTVYTISDIDNKFDNVVSLTQYQTDQNGVVTELNSQESRISQNETAINQRVETTTYESGINRLQANIDGIEIGGRNLVRNSDETKTIDNSFSGYNLTVDSTLELLYEKIVVSFEARSLDSVSDTVRVYWRGGNSTYYMENVEISDEWKRYTVITEMTESIAERENSQIAFHTGSFSFKGKFRNVKVEKGNKATDWTPAPEDIDYRITTAFTEIDQNAQQITLKASQTDVNSLTGRMSTAEGTISVLSDDILIKVNKDDLISEINLRPEGVRIKGSLIELDGLTLIEDGIIQNSHIENLSASKVTFGTMLGDRIQVDSLNGNRLVVGTVIADHLNVSQLSSVSSDLGTVTAGLLLSSNNNMRLNLNTGNLTMQNAVFELGGGADISFTNPGNRMYYSLYDDSVGYSRTAGVGFGRSINDTYPFAFFGTTGTGRVNFNAADGVSFSGFITNTRARTAEDGIGNSVVGNIFQVRDAAVSYSMGFEFDLFGDTGVLRGISSGIYRYYLGQDDNHFTRLYLSGSLRTDIGYLDIRNTSVTSQGYRFETWYDGNPQMAFRGLSAGSGNFYNLGTSLHRWRYVYLVYQPNVSSDERLKEGITNNTLGLDFISDLETKSFRMKSHQHEPEQLGLIAQQLKRVLIKHGADTEDISMLSVGEDGMYNVTYEQFIPPAIKAIQELNHYTKEEINWLKMENQLLKLRVTQLEEKIA